VYNNPLKFTDPTGNKAEDEDENQKKQEQQKTDDSTKSKDSGANNSNFDAGSTTTSNRSSSPQGVGGADNNAGSGSTVQNNSNNKSEPSKTDNSSEPTKAPAERQGLEENVHQASQHGPQNIRDTELRGWKNHEIQDELNRLNKKGRLTKQEKAWKRRLERQQKADYKRHSRQSKDSKFSDRVKDVANIMVYSAAVAADYTLPSEETAATIQKGCFITAGVASGGAFVLYVGPVALSVIYEAMQQTQAVPAVP